VPYGTVVTFSSDTRDAVIYYTTDNTAPTVSSPRYTGPLTLISDVNIRAIAVASGYIDSDVSEYRYRIRGISKTAEPVANIGSSTVTYGTIVILTTSTADARIYYTTNGSNPTANSYLYTGPISITQAVTIKAIAVSRNLPDSDIVTYQYALRQGETNPYSMTVSLQIDNREYLNNGVISYFDVAPYIEPASNRTMIPIRFIAEGLGANVYWDNDTKTSYISLHEKSLSIVLNRELPNNMGASRLINDRLFVPIRYVSEQLGAKVDWDANTRTVYISK